eukprot:355515-Chlamydomonas_euryale.AAC.1
MKQPLPPEKVIKCQKQWAAMKQEDKKTAVDWANKQLGNCTWRGCEMTPEGAAVPLLEPYASAGLKAALRDAFSTNFPVVSVLQLAWVSVRIMNRLQNQGITDPRTDHTDVLANDTSFIQSVRDKIVGITLYEVGQEYKGRALCYECTGKPLSENFPQITLDDCKYRTATLIR